MATTLDDSVFKHWDKSGKAEFTKRVRQSVTSGSSWRVRSSGWDSCKQWLRQLLKACVRGRVRPAAAATTLGELLMSESSCELASHVVDVFVLVDLEASAKEERGRVREVLVELEKFLPEAVLKERLDMDTLSDAGIVSKRFFTAIVKLKTKLFYKQQKFNLFREESEGYAKLITELSSDLARADAKDVLEIIKEIIGYFNLDPNRVLDLILEAFECQLECEDFFVGLLREFTPDSDTLNELLGFKFHFYQESDGVPESLFREVALLIQRKIISLDSIYSLLGPEDDVIFKEAQDELDEAKEFVQKMNVVSTNSSANNNESDATQSKAVAKVNQKFSLIEALLKVGAWQEAEKIISRLPTVYVISNSGISKALQELIHSVIEPLYRKCSKSLSTSSSKNATQAVLMGDLPAVATFEQFLETAMPLLLTLGPFCYNDTFLMVKVLRIIKHTFQINGEGQVGKPSLLAEHKPELLTLADEWLLPSLSLTESNCCLAEEVWSVIRVLPFEDRYLLYGFWKASTFNHYPFLLKKKASVQKSIKRIMQRISKENVRQTSRQLGKLTHSSPGLLFDYMLSQIQLYDNMIVPVIDSLKYLTNLSLDVLAYSIIEALSNPEKDRTKTDGTSISLWLQSLSSFCGAVFKKYSIDMTGLMQYVANQLKNRKSLDLLIVKEIVLKMAGIEMATDMTDEQIDAMSGGDILRQEAGSFNQIKNTRKSSQRLKDALIDNNLAVPLCLLMAQQRNCVVYDETKNSHLKLVGKLVDQCQDTLVQFGVFLASNLSMDDYTHTLPPITEILTRYHVNLDLAFFLARPMFNHQISIKQDELKQSQDWKGKSDQRRYTEASSQVMNPVIEAIRPLHSSKIWDDISAQFLTTFWSLTMYDLYVPEEVYSKELNKLKLAPSKLDDNKEMNSTRKKKERERLNALYEKLQDEHRRQTEHVALVLERLKEEKDSWFFSRTAKLAKNETITTFLQLCLFPRCVFTEIDAKYCVKFVEVVHMLKTPNFSTLICFDRILCDITYTVTSCSENEAHRYGRFLLAVLDLVMRWHASKDVFQKECVGYPGFMTKFRVDAKTGGDDHVDYENYRHLCHKWHYKIAKALVVCLESKDYVQIRNALTVLFKLLPRFPIITNLATVVEKRIEKVCNEEKEARKDLYVIAASYLGLLKGRKSNMLKEHEFHASKKPAPNSNGEDSTDSSSSKSKESNKRASKERKEENGKDNEGGKKSRAGSSERSSRENSKSKDREGSKERRSKGSRERDLMGPPSSRKSSERTSETDRDLKRRRLESSPTEKEQSRGKSKSRERSVEGDDSKKRGERKREHSEEEETSDALKKTKKDEERRGKADRNGETVKRAGSKSRSNHSNK